MQVLSPMRLFKCFVFILTILVVLSVLFFLKRDNKMNKELLPGIKDMDSSLLDEFEKTRRKKDPSYRPRTRHLDSTGWALFTNRLFLEKSPYLLQHAHNPVNWYPWGEEAFREAKKRDWPVLLSVGYSTCHWCHVMEEESFEDMEIARFMNENYVAIKVDREERPDIDSVYMNAVQMITGRGGWPMTVWLTPDKRVFYGGTYFPPRRGDRGSPVGFLSLLQELKKVYGEKRKDITEAGKEIQKILKKNLSPDSLSSHDIPDKKVFQNLQSQITERWDSVYGGIQGAPKFPSSLPSRFLLRSFLKTRDEKIREIIHTSLKGMLKGGIHDQVGGGFHRYSTDEKWLIPHFEKMLYDQALLALVYLEAYQLFKTESYKDAAVGILDYVTRDMQSKEGGFYSATDADSLSTKPEKTKDTVSESLKSDKNHLHKGKREEGFYFTWTPGEIDRVLDKRQAELVKNHYGVSLSGNFEGRNIFHVSRPLSETAGELKMDLTEAKKLLTSAREALYQARKRRPPPLRDEKILSGWNGLMISAFVYGYFVLNEKKYLLQAEKSARFVLNNMHKKDRLYRSWREGVAYIPGYLDDYAFFISALLDLFEWTGKIEWLKEAVGLDRILEEDFEDKQKGGFFMTARDYEPLLVREKPFYDGAEPSGNSVAVMNLLRLGELTGNHVYEDRAKKAFGAFGLMLKNNPFSFSEALLALDYYHNPMYEIVLVLPDGNLVKTDPFFNELKKWYLPNKVLTVVSHSQIKERQELLKPVRGKKAVNEKTTVYVCKKGVCQLPVFELKELKRKLKEIQTFTL